jgi:hypothetical protein
MRIKHRIPSIFNLSMVDVLCCALGCVILLWLLNLRTAKQSAVAAGRAGADLIDTRKLLADSRKSEESLAAEMRAARARQSELDRALAGLHAENDAALERLARKTQEQADLAREMAETRNRLATTEAGLREKETLLKKSARRADDLIARLNEAEDRDKKLQRLADQIPGLKEEAQRYRTRLDAAMARAQALEKDVTDRKRDLVGTSSRLSDVEEAKRRLERDLLARGRDLDEANRRLELLQGDKRSLANELARARESADNRFAGISLTGRRVVFLVDISGSMELVDENTPAPEKWAGVRETLAKILKSLPDLEKFQVIVFSDRATHLLGSEGAWLSYDPRASVDRVGKVLASVKPTGNTNLSAAFEAAFRYRDQGLDTIYILSDGLPNVGAGLDPAAAEALKETERAEILGNHVRKLLRTAWNRSVAGRRVRINAVGFFYESPDVGAFLWALARENDGSFVGMSKP